MSETYKVILEITADAYILRGDTNITDVVWILEAAKKNGFDTGSSSKTIFAVMTGRNVSDGLGSYPYDPDDFGRCHRLLELFPEWRPRLHEVSARYPLGWTGLVEHWDELAEYFELEQFNMMYLMMKSYICAIAKGEVKA